MGSRSALEDFSDLVESLQEVEIDDLRQLALYSKDDPESAVTFYAACNAIFRDTDTDDALDEAIRSGEQLLAATTTDGNNDNDAANETPSDERQNLARLSEEVGQLHHTKFMRCICKDDIDRAVSLAQQAIDLTPADSSEFSRRMELFVTWDDTRTGAAKAGFSGNSPSNATRTPITPSQRTWLASLHNAPFDSMDTELRKKLLAMMHVCLEKYAQLERTKSQEDLDQTIYAAKVLLSAIPSTNAFRPFVVLRLANALCLGSESQLQLHLEQIDECIGELGSALKKLQDPVWRGTGLDKLSDMWSCRYSLTSDRDNLTKAVAVSKQAVNLRFVDPDQHGARLHAVATKLVSQFHVTQIRRTLEEGLNWERDALRVLSDPAWPSSPSPPLRAMAPTNLATIVSLLYSATDDSKYLDEGLQVCEVLEGTLGSEPDYTMPITYWDTYATLLRQRYFRDQVKDDIDRAAVAARKATEGFPPTHRQHARMLNLSHTLFYQAILSPAPDFRETLKFAREASGRVPNLTLLEAQALTCLLNPLAYGKPGANFDTAVKLGRKAVQCTSPGTPENYRYRSNLARILRLKARSMPIGRAGDLWTEAIDTAKSVLENTTHRDPARCRRLFHFGAMMEERCKLLASEGLLDDAEQGRIQAADAYEECSHLDNATPSFRITAATRAADILMNTRPNPDFARSNKLLQHALALLRQVSPKCLTAQNQKSMIKKFVDLTTSATAAALQVDTLPEQTLRMLEESRAVILGLLVDTRSDLAELKLKHAGIAERFERVRDALNSPTSHDGLDFVDTLELADTFFSPTHRQKTLRQFEAVVNEIRKLEGFSNFLFPPPTGTLTSAASKGPLVVVNVSNIRSDAFIVRANQPVDMVHLPNLQPESIEGWVNRLRAGRHGVGRDEMVDMLEWLWDVLAGPVLQRLESGLGALRADTTTRVWWIPAGPLCALPIHAAGKYDLDSRHAGRSVLDKVVPSYRPVIRTALLRPRIEDESAQHELWSVAMNARPLWPTLGSVHYNGTPDDGQGDSELSTHESPLVVRGPLDMGRLMKREVYHYFRSVIYNCVQNDNPITGLEVPQGPAREADSVLVEKLVHEVADILSLGYFILADFLGWENNDNNDTDGEEGLPLPEDSLRLVSPGQMLGFRHAVDTMWKVNDVHWRHIIAHFILSLRADAARVLSDDALALAVRDGIKSLRDGAMPLPPNGMVGRPVRHGGTTATLLIPRYMPEDPLVWAVFMHMGP